MRCIDEGTLQAAFDGELNAHQAAAVAAHLHGCVHCSEAARMLEVENLILSRGLSAEFGETVPTERLRHRVEAAVAGLPVTTAPATNRSWANAFRKLIPSSALAYASIAAAIVIAGIFVAVNLRQERSEPSPRDGGSKEVVATGSQALPEPPQAVVAGVPPKTAAPARPKSPRKLRTSAPDGISLAWLESQYQDAFPKLTEAIKAQAPLRPSLRVEYEYNLALIDNAITTTSQIARKNPKDPLATQSMLAAYQSKIDLMNQVAQARLSDQ
jgi:anti-sigma factor RsiW